MAKLTTELWTNPDTLNAIIDGVEKGIATLCSDIRSQAVVLAPVDTGHLRNSIVWKTSEAGTGEIAGVPQPKKMNGYVGSGLDYAVYQEFGTRKMAPQPFLRPAIAIKAKGQKGEAVMKKRMDEVLRGKLTDSNINKRETF